MPPSPSPSRADSSPAGSPARNAGLFADPGPEFDPGTEPEAEAGSAGPEPGPEALPDAGQLTIEWNPERVKLLLRAQGEVLHTAVAVDKASGEWRYTDAELQSIGEPLTAILNRHDATRAAAAAGDELALIVGMSGYVMRSYGARRAALARLADAPDEPVSGVAAPAGTGPTAEDEAVRADPFTFPPDLDDDVETPPIGGRRR